MQTFTPIEYLKIDVASSFGLDKKTWDERIAWFDENEEELIDVLQEPNKKILDKKLKIAKEPALFYAGLKAYEKASKGQAISYPISLDATASGAQLLAILIGCQKSASLCNVVDTGDREDLYTNVYNAMCERLGTESKISHAPVKKAIMTSLYGSEAQPKRVFGEGALLDTFYETMEEEATGIWKLAKGWAEDNHLAVISVPAQWDTHGKKAGYLRNVEMADLNPDFILAFPGGRGTKMMIDIANKRGIKVYEVEKLLE